MTISLTIGIRSIGVIIVIISVVIICAVVVVSIVVIVIVIIAIVIRLLAPWSLSGLGLGLWSRVTGGQVGQTSGQDQDPG